MRVSLDPNDPNYIKNATHIDAYVNKQLIFDCITVDEEKGYVIRKRRHAGGQLHTIGGIVQTQRLEGRVMLAGFPYSKRAQSDFVPY